MVSTTDFIAAIELGSSKIAGIVGKKNGDGSIQILAHVKEESASFIRKGVIFNLDKTAQSLASIINKLESSLNCSIAKVYVGISGQSLHTVKHSITRDLEDETVISQELIDAICDENIGTPLDDLDILDVVPQEYKVGNKLLIEPVGVPTNYIEGNFMNIVARTSIRKNLERCFAQAKIEIADMFISPLITAQAVLTESEMRSGCALVDIGADTTTISIYKGSILRFLSVLPLGGNSITRDIASLQMEEQEAEKLKIKYGNAIFDYESEAKGPETIQSEESQTTVELFALNDIIEARTEEIVANIWNQIERSNYEGRLLSGIVITGGSSNLRNIDELIRRKSKIEKVRVALAPHYNISSPDHTNLKDGTQNTLFGLIAAGTENCYQPQEEAPADPSKGLFADDEDFVIPEQVVTPKPSKKGPKEKPTTEEDRGGQKSEKKNWFKSTFDKLSNELFSEEDMK